MKPLYDIPKDNTMTKKISIKSMT